MGDAMDAKAMEWAERASDLIVDRVEADRVRNPSSPTADLFNEIRRNSHMGPMTAELARMKLGIV